MSAHFNLREGADSFFPSNSSFEAPTRTANTPAAKKMARCSTCSKDFYTSYQGTAPTCWSCFKASPPAQRNNSPDPGRRATTPSGQRIYLLPKAVNSDLLHQLDFDFDHDEETASVVSSVSSTASFMTNSSATTSASLQPVSTSVTSGGGRSGGQRRHRTTYDLVVRNVYLYPCADDDALKAIFGRYGEVVGVRKVVRKAYRPKGKKQAKGALKTRSDDRESTLPLLPVIFVSFAEEASAAEAREGLDGFRAGGTVWQVEWAKKEERPQ